MSKKNARCYSRDYLSCFPSQDLTCFAFQELQRRLDQTLGKPGSYHHGIDREGHIKPMTIGARLYRLENQVIFVAHWLLWIYSMVNLVIETMFIFKFLYSGVRWYWFIIRMLWITLTQKRMPWLSNSLIV